MLGSGYVMFEIMGGVAVIIENGLFVGVQVGIVKIVFIDDFV